MLQRWHRVTLFRVELRRFTLSNRFLVLLRLLLGEVFLLLIEDHLFEFLVCIRRPSLEVVLSTRSQQPTVTRIALVDKAFVVRVNLRWSVELSHQIRYLMAVLRWHPLAVVLIVGAGLDRSPIIHTIAIVWVHLARF